MSEPQRVRCDDCHYLVSSHVANDGRFLGCPVRINALGVEHTLPRITVRIGKTAPHKGIVFIGWPDQLDAESGQIVVWNLDTGDQCVEDQAQLQRRTRRATRDQEYEVQAEIEYQIGGKVRIIAGNWGRAS